MQIRELDTEHRADRRAWEDLPARLYRCSAQWVPPLAGEARFAFDRRTNPFYAHSEAAFLGVFAGARLLGRMAVLDNSRYNAHHGRRTAFFTLFETVDDDEVVDLLFQGASDWAKRRGLSQLVGPRGFGALDGLGLLVQGHEYVPAMGIPYHLPYYERLLLGQGLRGIEDLHSGYMQRDGVIPERLHAVAARVMERRGLHVATFRHKRELRALIPAFRQLYNRSLALVADNIPLTEAEVAALAQRLLSIADPRLLKLVFRGDELVGFVFAYPDINTAIQRSGGRLWPLGWARLLAAQRTTRLVDINGMGISQEHQGLGGATILFSELIKTLVGSRFERAELVQIRADNERMQRELSSLPIQWAKVHRLYALDL